MRYLVQLLRRAEPKSDLNVARQAASLLLRNLKVVESFGPVQGPYIGGNVVSEPVLNRGLREQSLDLNPFSQPPGFRIGSPSSVFFQTLKTSAKRRKAKNGESSKGNANSKQGGTTSVTSRLADNLSKAHSSQKLAFLSQKSAPQSTAIPLVATTSLGSDSTKQVASTLGGSGVQEPPLPQFSGSEEERKGSRVVRIMAVMLLGYIGLNIYPLMGDSLITHAVALTRSKDPFLQRSGASRVAMIATSDKRRRKIVEAGGVASLANLVQNEDIDDTTLDQVLDALVKVCEGPEAIEALRAADLEPSLQQIAVSRTERAVLDNTLTLSERSAANVQLSNGV